MAGEVTTIASASSSCDASAQVTQALCSCWLVPWYTDGSVGYRDGGGGLGIRRVRGILPTFASCSPPCAGPFAAVPLQMLAV